MIKLLAVFDGLRFSEATFRHSIRIAKSQPAHLVGLFMEDFTYQSFSRYQAITHEQLSAKEIAALEKKDELKRKEAIDHFVKECQKAGVEHSVHRDKDVAFPTLMEESFYADLIILDSSETFHRKKQKAPTDFVRNFLASTESPVLLVNKKYTNLSKVILLFDGQPSSVFAIKQFSYLMGSHLTIDVEVLTVRNENASGHLPDSKLMKEFMKRHFPKAKYNVIKDDNPEGKIVEYIKNDPGNPLVVLGAYRRSMVSRWFKQSMADVLVQKTNVPVFIAHNKA
jgi:nucleotide-binding universal stress UspA family protein